MRDNSNSQLKTKVEKVGVENKGIRTVLIVVIILNGLIMLLLNPILFQILDLYPRSDKMLKPDLEMDSDSLLVSYTVCIFSLAIISICVLNLYLLKRGKLKFPTFFSNVSLMVLVVFVLLITLEIVLRIFFPHLGVNIYSLSYNKQFRMIYMKPNIDVLLITPEYRVNYRTNSLGLRGTKELPTKMQNEKRIMVLGDSFIHAGQVEQEHTMCCKLEEMLNSEQSVTSNGEKFTILNTAKSGWTPTDEREFLEKNFQFFNPDIVLLFVYVGNDFAETIYRFRRHNSEVSGMRSTIAIRFLKASKNLMIDRSRLFTFAYKRIREPKWPMGRPNQPFNDSKTNVFRKKYNDEINMAYRVIEAEILRINDICIKNGVSLHLFIIPTKEQVHRSKLRETVEFLKIDMNEIDLTKPQRILREFAVQNNIAVFDLLDVLREAGKSHPMYYEIDSHWNVFGNMVVAEAVFSYLRSKKS